ncbi:Parapinopsin [Liparis tanakae]|uniref:Parapinopsin n=1 Tax=Liparis tanakae TaxID=230148 RepID=A0A4Z2G0T6_9TELE|nr:Parapinopsin [Liparis tanakae]
MAGSRGRRRQRAGPLLHSTPRPDGSVLWRKLRAAANFSAQPGMIVCNVSLSCAHCPGGGAGGTTATATDAYEEVSGSLPPASLSPRGHLVVAVCLGFIGTFGFLSNLLVLALFCRYRALRTPMNLLLVSISASDLLVSMLGTPFSFAASTQGRWLIGRAGKYPHYPASGEKTTRERDDDDGEEEEGRGVWTCTKPCAERGSGGRAVEPGSSSTTTSSGSALNPKCSPRLSHPRRWFSNCGSCPSSIVSLISLAVLSYERYSTMMKPTIADGRDFRPALGGITFSWLYSVAWTVPPLLGWSRYGPEGPGTTCSVDWRTQTPNNISYIVCLFAFCLVLPFAVILYSYGKLLHAIRQVRLQV